MMTTAMTTTTARAIFHELVSASAPPRQAEGQEDLVGGVGDRGQGVAGEHRQRQALGEEGLAEPVAAHRAAEDHALDDTPGG